ncbi:PIN-like domain-containing protein [Proteiniphilum sp.]|uniref:PIN-like domain-containing protein n=1 Tax=Proteiniphilum sp. TaxID=1926877 RepID=UPI00331EB534
MKSKFNEYYKLSEKEIKDHWENDIFCFDANVLLNLYRYSPSTREAFFSLLEKVEDRIWITYQAAFEYQKNRLIVINAQREAYKDIRDTLSKKKGEIEAKLNSFKKHPYLQITELKRQLESAFDSIGRDLDKLESKHPDYLDKDPVWEKLSILLEGKVGDDFPKEELEKLYKEGKKRYDEKVPPGYMDMKEKQNEGNRSLYGDIIVWKQVIEKAKTVGKSIILITDDLKEDWWYKFKGKTISPRPELIKEFKEETSKRINIYQADKFLEMANKNLAQQTKQEAIQEIRNVRLADERDIEKEIKELEMFLEDNGVEDFRKYARDLIKPKKSDFETAIEESINKNKLDNNE